LKQVVSYNYLSRKIFETKINRWSRVKADAPYLRFMDDISHY